MTISIWILLACVAAVAVGAGVGAALLLTRLRDIKKQLDGLPLEQLRAISDSEKRFQDGLDAILGYFGPVRGDHKP